MFFSRLWANLRIRQQGFFHSGQNPLSWLAESAQSHSDFLDQNDDNYHQWSRVSSDRLKYLGWSHPQLPDHGGSDNTVRPAINVLADENLTGKPVSG